MNRKGPLLSHHIWLVHNLLNTILKTIRIKLRMISMNQNPYLEIKTAYSSSNDHHGHSHRDQEKVTSAFPLLVNMIHIMINNNLK